MSSSSTKPLETIFGSKDLAGWRRQVHDILFGDDTRLARIFDVILILIIIGSVIAVMLESVPPINARYHTELYALEWIFTLIFTIEYILRLVCVGKPLQYARSFYGIVDLLAAIPTYFSVILPGIQALLVIRLLRILRVFRVLKLVQYLSEANVLLTALRTSRRKITVFVIAVLTLVTILGSLMYVIESADAGFDSIPRSVYWAIVTLTTVGYGDISPQTPVGQALAALIMIIGYSIIAVPTGIVTAEISRTLKTLPIGCSGCHATNHERDAQYCRKCGASL